MIQPPLYPRAMSSADSVSSLLITTNLPSNFSAALILASVQLRPAPPIRAQIAAEAARGHQRAGRLRVIVLALLQQGQFGVEFDAAAAHDAGVRVPPLAD